MQINWGVRPLKSVAVYTTEDICDNAIDLICAKQLAEAGDMVVLTLGIPSTNVSENRTVSNMMRIAMVDDRKQKIINEHGNTENLSPATSLAYFGIEKQKAKGLEIFGSEAFCFFDCFPVVFEKDSP